MADDEFKSRDEECDDFADEEEGGPGDAGASEGEFVHWPRDPRLDPAKADVMVVIEGNASLVFYGRQIEVILEKKYFHWITHKALRELTRDGKITTEIRVTNSGNRLRLYWSAKNRYPRRAAAAVVRQVEEHSNTEVTRAIGNHAENLFGLAAGREGFRLYGPALRTYRGRTWDRTEHDLDWIFERDEIGWGVEIKNTWAYIDRQEMYVKIEMCKYLGVKPLFIMRWAPKSYVEVIRQNGGFGLLYETQLFPAGHTESVEKLRGLFLPVSSMNAVPEDVFVRFLKYGHDRAVKVQRP